MDNLMTFFFSPNGFVPYLVTYFVYIAAIVIAFYIGFALRKNKNKKVSPDWMKAVLIQKAKQHRKLYSTL